MIKNILKEQNGISGKVVVTLKDAEGNILKRVKQNTINNSLRNVFAKLLRYGSEDASNFPSFKATKIKLSNAANCHSEENLKQILGMCDSFELADENVASGNDVTLLTDTYSYIEAEQNNDISEVRFGIVIPMNYKFKVAGTDTDTYTVSELGLYATIGGSETLIAWTHLGDNAVEKRPENIMSIVWIIQIT